MISILRQNNIAWVSFSLWLCSMFWLIPCAALSMGVCWLFGVRAWQEGVIFFWFAGIAATIWYLGGKRPREEWDLSLSILKVLQVAVLVVFVPAFWGLKEGFHYVSLMMEFLQFGALLVYGAFCLRVRRRPGLAYCGALAMTAGLMVWSYHALEQVVNA